MFRYLLPVVQAEKGFDSEVDAEFLEAIRNGYLTTHHTMWKDVGELWDLLIDLCLTSL